MTLPDQPTISNKEPIEIIADLKKLLPIPSSIIARKSWWLKNMPVIRAAYNAIKVNQICDTLGITPITLAYHIKMPDKLTEEETKIINSADNIQSSPASIAPDNSDSGRVIRFPDFDSKWDPSVQIAWLDAYTKLMNK
jgi:hypothetical protein